MPCVRVCDAGGRFVGCTVPSAKRRHKRRGLATLIGSLFLSQLRLAPCAEDDLPGLDHLRGITLFNLARLAGQTGPLTDFRSGRAVLRYAGLNLRWGRQSRTYRWTITVHARRASRRRGVHCSGRFWGRPSSLCSGGRSSTGSTRALHGPYYPRKREEGMPPQKAKVAVMREFLCMLRSLACSGEAFDPERFTTCESQYAKAA